MEALLHQGSFRGPFRPPSHRYPLTATTIGACVGSGVGVAEQASPQNTSSISFICSVDIALCRRQLGWASNAKQRVGSLPCKARCVRARAFHHEGKTSVTLGTPHMACYMQTHIMTAVPNACAGACGVSCAQQSHTHTHTCRQTHTCKHMERLNALSDEPLRQRRATEGYAGGSPAVLHHDILQQLALARTRNWRPGVHRGLLDELPCTRGTYCNNNWQLTTKAENTQRRDATELPHAQTKPWATTEGAARTVGHEVAASHGLPLSHHATT